MASSTRARHVSACPACDGRESEQVGGEVPAYDSQVGGKKFTSPAYVIRHCSNCGLYFKSDTLHLDELEEYYSRFAAESYEQDQNFPPDGIIRAILQGLPPGAKVLDYGCSSGRVHNGLTTTLEVYGVEINAEAANIARKRGIRIVTEQDVRGGKIGPFEVIIAADVHEHLPHPTRTLDTLAAVLAPGGRLIVVTGNADAVRTRDWMGEFWYFRPEGHFHMMSEAHIPWLAKHLSMRVEELHRCSHYSLPMRIRLRQHVQSFAYEQFKRSPRAPLSAILRFVPVLNRAERWPLSPALTCTADHFVAVFRK